MFLVNAHLPCPAQPNKHQNMKQWHHFGLWCCVLLLQQALVAVTAFTSVRSASRTERYQQRRQECSSLVETCLGFRRSNDDDKIQRDDSSVVLLKATPTDTDVEIFSTSISGVPLLVIVALGLGFAAQGWINQQLQGDQGLGAFLQDGQGYKKSGFRPLSDRDRAASSDPLPWLSLPKLDFVEVAGQESTEDALMAELEQLRLAMNQQLERGNTAEANAIRLKLESRMRENGVEFQMDE